jgi:putative ABC transport system permease protein
MTRLAWKNLFHDKVRLVVTLTGIVFALVLIIVQFGLFLGFTETSANIVERSGADLWISAPGIPHVNGGSPMPEKRRYKALSVPGVEKAERYALQFVNWKLPTGAQESVQIAGFELSGGMGGPWDLVAGSVDDLRAEDTVIIDELYARKLGVTSLGQTVEINGHRARVAGFTRGIRSFTTAPYVFTSFKNAQNYARLQHDETLFLLVRARAGEDVAVLKQRLLAAIPNVDVFTNAEIHAKTRDYWLFNTGAGVTTLMGSILGLLVGIVVVAQTIYAATVDHIREFGTLKAMGAKNRYIYRVIIEQAVLSAGMGYGVAITVGWFIVRNSERGEAAILMPPAVAAGIFGLAILMCVAASVISIRKATSIDPAMVFRG